MSCHEKLVIITKKTALEELVERFNTREQARFYLEQMGVAFADYQAAHDAYHRAKSILKAALPQGARAQWLERDFLPTFTFGEGDLVVALGPDGLVVNVAKYLSGQPLLAFNPDAARIDGVLLPFPVWQAAQVLPAAAQGRYQLSAITMARATLGDGQTLHALNDLFIGARTHVSARYQIRHNGKTENHSSSGIIVATGTGSTGWWRSILTGSAEIAQKMVKGLDAQAASQNFRFDRCADELRFAVREPFISVTSSAGIVFGSLRGKGSLEIVSQMPQNGVIFSDGIESDFLEFNSGAIAKIGVAQRKLQLIAGL